MSKQSYDYFDDNELNELELTYESAMEILRTHLEVLISNFEMENGGTKSVEHFGARLKKILSAVNKLRKKKCEISVVEIEKNLNDMVGIRLVCPFIEDVYKIVELIKKSDLIVVCNCEDYIKYPKKSGYRSCHLEVMIPVPVGDKQKNVKCEIQVRTLAMDAWAALEHKIRYKPTGPKKITARQEEMLVNCAKAFMYIEEEMTNLHLGEHVASESKKNYIDGFDSVFSEKEKNELEFQYDSALKILETYLNVEIRNYDFIKETKSVEHINSRVKTISSICRKLSQKNLDLTIDNITNNINDGAAIRLVCPFIEDVYDMVRLIYEVSSHNKECPFRVYEARDYIINPKKSGYRGYHLLVEVNIPGQEKKVKAEIQVRTLAMDAWAAMEDRIKYNQDYYYTAEQESILKIYSDTFVQIEEYMGCLLHPEDAKSKHVLDEYFSGFEEDGEQKNGEKIKAKKKTL